jgi:tetratricopeptide (TPR) repeat protein
MKRTMTVLSLALSLVACAVQSGRTEPLSNTAKPDNLEKAKQEEQKGDLARIHGGNLVALPAYYAALRAGGPNAELLNKLGVTELQLGERGAARKHFSQALKFDPRSASAMNNMGAALLLDKKYKPAVGYLKRALAQDEENAPVHINLGEAWLGLGDMDRAMNEYSRALEIDADVLSSNPEGTIARVKTPEQRARVSFLIAKSYMKRGNLEGALEYLQRAKEDRYPDLAKVYSDPDFAPLWKDPRLAKIVKR